MRKFLTVILTVILTLTALATPVYASSVTMLDINTENSEKGNTHQYGIYIDNGTALSGDLILNNSFEFGIDYWSINSLTASTENNDNPVNQKNPSFITLTANGKGTLTSLGDVIDTSQSAAIGFKTELEYNFSCFVKNVDFDGTVSVYLDSVLNRNNITELDISNTDGLWTRLDATLTSVADEIGGLIIELNGNGTLCLDLVSLVPQDCYSSEFLKHTSFRTDIYTAVKQLKPSFIEFELGDWKSTTGTTEERVQTTDTNGNINSNAVGCYEYFCICSDIGAEPIPVITGGDGLQKGTGEWNAYVQDIIDLIEYANGNSTASYYGALRTADGSAEPFGLKQIALTGDNTASVEKKIKKLYPKIKFISPSEKAYEFFNISDTTNAFSMTGQSSDKISFAPLFVPLSKDTNAIIAYNLNELVLSPAYYTQMIFANNCGDELLSSSYSDGIFTSATIDRKNQTVFIKLINTSGKKQQLSIGVNGLRDDIIGRVSVQSVKSRFADAVNGSGKNTVYPTEQELACNSEKRIDYSLEKYEAAVIRIAYGSNSGAELYSLPELIDTVAQPSTYYPLIIKTGVPIGAVCVLLVLVAVIIVCVKKSKRTKKNQ